MSRYSGKKKEDIACIDIGQNMTYAILHRVGTGHKEYIEIPPILPKQTHKPLFTNTILVIHKEMKYSIGPDTQLLGSREQPIKIPSRAYIVLFKGVLGWLKTDRIRHLSVVVPDGQSGGQNLIDRLTGLHSVNDDISVMVDEVSLVSKTQKFMKNQSKSIIFACCNKQNSDLKKLSNTVDCKRL